MGISMGISIGKRGECFHPQNATFSGYLPREDNNIYGEVGLFFDYSFIEIGLVMSKIGVFNRAGSSTTGHIITSYISSESIYHKTKEIEVTFLPFRLFKLNRLYNPFLTLGYASLKYQYRYGQDTYDSKGISFLPIKIGIRYLVSNFIFELDIR